MSARFISKVCDRMLGRDTDERPIRVSVNWDEDSFEKCFREHLSDKPFARPPASIRGLDAGLRMLEARLGISSPDL